MRRRQEAGEAEHNRKKKLIEDRIRAEQTASYGSLSASLVALPAPEAFSMSSRSESPKSARLAFYMKPLGAKQTLTVIGRETPRGRRQALTCRETGCWLMSDENK